MNTETISVDGEHLTLDDVVAIARGARPVALADAAREGGLTF